MIVGTKADQVAAIVIQQVPKFIDDKPLRNDEPPVISVGIKVTHSAFI